MRGSTHRAPAWLAVASLAVTVLGCGAEDTETDIAPSTSPSTSPSASPAWLEDVTGELILTRQRDLIDRGLISVLVDNDSDTSMLMDDIELVADFFAGEPAPRRAVSVRSDRQVAVQVPFGVVDDCDTDRPVTAELTFRSTHDDAAARPVRLELAGTDLLDSIRAGQCATQRFEAAARTRFEGTEIVDGTVVTDLVIEPVGGDTSPDVAIEAVSGTILIGVRAEDHWAGGHLDAGLITIPLTFVVNRCDPHGLAEITKRYGLDLSVSVDGAPAVAVAVDVDELVTHLGAIVDECIAAAAGD